MEFCADSAGCFVREVMGQQMGHDIPTGDGQMAKVDVNGEIVQSFPIFGMQHRSIATLSEEIQEQFSGLFHYESICTPRANAKLHRRINSFA